MDVAGSMRGTPGAGASGRNGGFLLAGPPRPTTRSGPASAASGDRAVPRTAEALDATAQAHPEAVRRVGSLRVSRSPAEDVDVDAQLAAMREDGLPVERYDGPEGRGLRFPHDAAFHPLRRARSWRAARCGRRPAVRRRCGERGGRPGACVTDAGAVARLPGRARRRRRRAGAAGPGAARPGACRAPADGRHRAHARRRRRRGRSTPATGSTTGSSCRTGGSCSAAGGTSAARRSGCGTAVGGTGLGPGAGAPRAACCAPTSGRRRRSSSGGPASSASRRRACRCWRSRQPGLLAVGGYSRHRQPRRPAVRDVGGRPAARPAQRPGGAAVPLTSVRAARRARGTTRCRVVLGVSRVPGADPAPPAGDGPAVTG